MNRRVFLENAGLVGVGASILHSSLPVFSSPFDEQQNTPTVEPTPAQRRWMQLKFGMFIHFGINTYYDKEWSDGTLSPSKYNPTELDTDQWCYVASKAGMKYIVLVTKHHDGFCNWHTAFTDYCTKNTPWGGDLVAEVVKSARKYGLEVGFYYSLWDRHEKTHDTDDNKYVEFMIGQLTELLTQYGPIVELWFDGMWRKQTTGWKKKPDYVDAKSSQEMVKTSPEEFLTAWRFEGAYRWQMDRLYQHIKKLQPYCMVANNATTEYPGLPLHPVDITSGEKATEVKHYKKVWNFAGKDMYFPMQIETTMSTEGRDMFKSGSWFWHEWDKSVLSKEKIKEYLNIASKMEANLLLNVGPMANGKLRPEDERVLLSLNS
ncbi:MAG: alpha-L-fucosidase [Cytophagales bacterium]|nr:alpha-L-fucosidase [Cytophagales bacterium]MDW8385107.1 alpha-L-fucosidase [Flammeovirgaceae bacterium]